MDFLLASMAKLFERTLRLKTVGRLSKIIIIVLFKWPSVPCICSGYWFLSILKVLVVLSVFLTIVHLCHFHVSFDPLRIF